MSGFTFVTRILFLAFAVAGCSADFGAGDGSDGVNFAARKATTPGSPDSSNVDEKDRGQDGDLGADDSDASGQLGKAADVTNNKPGKSGKGDAVAGAKGANGDDQGKLGADGGTSEGANLGEDGGLLESDCRFMQEKSCKEYVEGFPLDFDVCSMVRSGAMKFDGDDLVGAKKVYIADGKSYLNLDEVERNDKFLVRNYNIRIEDARSAACTARGSLDGLKSDEVRTGCFLATTPIRMGDGTEKPAQDIRRGDEVWNPMTQSAAVVTEIVKGKEKDAGMIEVGTASGLVVVTATHPFLTASGMKQASELTKIDRIAGTKPGTFEPITRLVHRPLDPTTRVFNFVINSVGTSIEQHMVLAGGIVTGDLDLQRRLEAERNQSRSLAGRTHKALQAALDSVLNGY